VSITVDTPLTPVLGSKKCSKLPKVKNSNRDHSKRRKGTHP